MRVHYDEEGDFLEIGVGKPTKCYAEEVKPGVFIRIDEKSEEVKSIGILSFKKGTKEVILKRVLKQLGISIPLEISVPSN